MHSVLNIGSSAHIKQSSQTQIVQDLIRINRGSGYSKSPVYVGFSLTSFDRYYWFFKSKFNFMRQNFSSNYLFSNEFFGGSGKITPRRIVHLPWGGLSMGTIRNWFQFKLLCNVIINLTAGYRLRIMTAAWILWNRKSHFLNWYPD